MLSKNRVALICGGSSSERHVSLKSGKQVYSAIDKDKYDVVVYDPLTDILRLVNDSNGIDFAFIILHGSCGEDGTIQGLLDLLGIPYQGSGVLGSAAALNKIISKRLFEQAGLPIAPYIVLDANSLLCNDCSAYVEDKLGFPVVIKPAEAGSSIGVSVVKRKEDLSKAASNTSEHGNFFLIESYIEGIELTCGVLGNDLIEKMPVVEIIHDIKRVFFDFEAKYSKELAREICPARITKNLTEKAQWYAKRAHEVLFCRGYSRTDMILRNNNFYILETNTIPGMTPESLYPKSAFHMGFSFESLIERLITLGLEDGRRK